MDINLQIFKQQKIDTHIKIQHPQYVCYYLLMHIYMYYYITILLYIDYAC